MSIERATVTAPAVLQAKGVARITALTAYDFQTARVLDEAGVDIILVGDSLAMAYQGRSTTIPVTLDDMIYHTRLVSRAVSRALVVMDMPFGTYHASVDEAVMNAVRAVKEGGAHAVKIEGGTEERVRVLRALVAAEIPVMAHIGLTPQSIHRMGGYRKQRAREALLAHARAVSDAGAFSCVLEVVDEDIANEITESIACPTIGIGSGPHCDGQILVINDVLGFLHTPPPSFAKQYANLNAVINDAVTRYIADVNETDAR